MENKEFYSMMFKVFIFRFCNLINAINHNRAYIYCFITVSQSVMRTYVSIDLRQHKRDRWWDKLMKTENVKYHEAFDEVTSRPKACALKEKKEKISSSYDSPFNEFPRAGR